VNFRFFLYDVGQLVFDLNLPGILIDERKSYLGMVCIFLKIKFYLNYDLRKNEELQEQHRYFCSLFLLIKLPGSCRHFKVVILCKLISSDCKYTKK